MTDEIPEPLHRQLFSHRRYLGFYAHYAASGLLWSSVNVTSNLCYYYFSGSDNICSNAYNLVAIPFGLKLLFALLLDSYSGPFGAHLRRKFYLCSGWGMVLFLSLLLAMLCSVLSVEVWIGLSLAVQIFAVLADTCADGLCIELGQQLESPFHRGQVLSTGQRVRFLFTTVGALLQATLFNGPSSNPPDCQDAQETFGGCWSWGLDPQQYYGMLFALLFVILLPLAIFVDPTTAASSVAPLKPLTFTEHRALLWQTLCQPTTLQLLVFVSGNNLVSFLSSIVQWDVQ